MSLQGTLDTFDLGDVLFLLERGHKSGALEVESEGSRAVLFLQDGRFAGAGTADAEPPASDPAGFEADLVDACAALLRLDEGTFAFDESRRPSVMPAELVDIGPVVAAAQRVADEWRALAAKLPSMDVPVLLVPELPVETLLVDRATWRVLTALDGRRSVRDLARDLGRPVVDVGRVVAELFERRIVVFYELPVDPVLLPPEPAQPARWEHEAPVASPVATIEVPLEAPLGATFEAPLGAPFEAPLGAPAPRSVGELAAWADEAPDPYAALFGGEPEATPGGGPEADAGASDDAAPDDSGADEMRRDRGALLRMFSSLKE